MSSTSSTPVHAADFAAISAAMSAEDEKREALIKRSRDVLKASKQAIYALQRGDTAQADGLIAQAKAAALPLLALLEASPQLRHGAMAAALEEWAEAVIFAVFLKEKRIATLAELEIGEMMMMLMKIESCPCVRRVMMCFFRLLPPPPPLPSSS
jgi:predicted translin family RNA/ssDNA-binding protein